MKSQQSQALYVTLVGFALTVIWGSAYVINNGSVSLLVTFLSVVTFVSGLVALFGGRSDSTEEQTSS